MSVVRVEKTRDYTVMANYHLRDRRLSLKAKGLLSLMLSVPDDWDFSIKGLAAICKEGLDAVRSGIEELESYGYVTRRQVRDDQGRLNGYEYTIFEKPIGVESPVSDNPTTVSPMTGFATQSNTEEVSKDESSSKKAKKEIVRHKYGEYSNVLLSDEELEKLKAEFPFDWDKRIENLSSYMASTGKAYKGHLATIRNWARKDKKAVQAKQSRNYAYEVEEAGVL